MRLRRHQRHYRAKDRVPKVKMTSMMDILTVLLLFLLKSFVVDPGIVPPPDVTLPTSSSDETPEVELVVAISRDAILVGDRPVITVANALAGDDLLIEELEAELGAELGRMDDLDARRGDDVREGEVTIQGDRDLEFQLLQRVMYTCSMAGFSRMSLAVVREG